MIKFMNETAEAIASAIPELDKSEILEMLELPQDSRLGDCALPCFKLSKILKKAPQTIAVELKGIPELSKNSIFERIENSGGYLNFFFNKSEMARLILSEICEKGDDYGKADIGVGKTVVIDYSSPNIAKPFHIGHLYSTLIGAALYRIFGFLGYGMVGINYIGDWGTQFGKLITAYYLWSSEEAVKRDGLSELLRIYIKYHAEAEENPALDDDARANLLEMEKGNEKILALWKWFRDISLEEYEKVYAQLGVSFDSYNGESFYNDKMADVVDELREKNLLEQDEGAMIVRLDDYKMPPCLILRSDGGTLYPTRDIASALYRHRTYKFHKSLYVTDARQALHFAQWMKVVGLMGYEFENDMEHVPYGYLMLESGAMQTRKGNFILVDDLINEAKQRVADVIDEKNPELQNKDTVAEQVGLGAIIFSTLYNSRRKDVTFVWSKILSFDGETGPYVQYTHARASSVLEKAGVFRPDRGIDYSLLSDTDSLDVIKLLSEYTARVTDAADKLEPYVVSRYVMQLAQAFNKFYHNNQILSAPDSLRTARLMLVYCVKTVIKSALALIGIRAPERM